MSAHTPGPWIVGIGLVADFQPLELHLAVGRQGDPWTPVALISRADKINDTDRANAALIAAAPDLLAALREIAAITDEDTATFRKRGGTYRGLIGLIAAAAIAKAEGQ